MTYLQRHSYFSSSSCGWKCSIASRGSQKIKSSSLWSLSTLSLPGVEECPLLLIIFITVKFGLLYPALNLLRLLMFLLWLCMSHNIENINPTTPAGMVNNLSNLPILNYTTAWEHLAVSNFHVRVGFWPLFHFQMGLFGRTTLLSWLTSPLTPFTVPLRL